ADGEDIGEVAADPGGQAAGAGTGGERQFVVEERLAPGEAEGLRRRVERLDLRSEAQGDALFRPERGGAKVEPFQLHLAEEIGLGERRTLVGGLWLLSDQRDGPGGAERPESGGQRGACLSGADDDDPAHSVSPLVARAADPISSAPENATREEIGDGDREGAAAARGDHAADGGEGAGKGRSRRKAEGAPGRVLRLAGRLYGHLLHRAHAKLRP